MSPQGPASPTESELKILRFLWTHGPSTVREVHEELCRQRGKKFEYTGTLKLLQIMHEKRLVDRDDSQRAHIYRPLMTEEGLRRHMTDDLLDRVFGGAVDQLVLHVLAGKKTSREELDKIRRKLDELEENGQ